MRRRTQADEVEAALQELGGYATLGDLYQKVNVNQWGTKTPYATIRRILQKDPQGRFFKIRPGLWGLKAQQQQILQKLAIGQDVTENQIQQFDHTYYQGLILQIGNLRRYRTFAPPADRKRLFLGKPLSEIVSLDAVPSFTYPALVQRARNIDASWFQARGQNHLLFPYAFFEVEHTTDFSNSLIKFTEFQDFRVHFYIVADGQRRQEFQKRLESSAFDSIRDWVRFIDYETVGKLYERELLASQINL